MPAKRGHRADAVKGRKLGVPGKAREAETLPVGPATVAVHFWLDREPELDTGGLAPWIVRDTLERVLYNLMPDEAEEDED